MNSRRFAIAFVCPIYATYDVTMFICGVILVVSELLKGDKDDILPVNPTHMCKQNATNRKADKM